MRIEDFLEARVTEDEARCADPHDWYHNNERLLAECGAKRRIMEAHPYTSDGGHCCADPQSGLGEEMYWNEPCPTLAALASIYDNHSDYDESWRV